MRTPGAYPAQYLPDKALAAYPSGLAAGTAFQRKMITDLNFYLVAIPAVLLMGLAKGGFLSSLGGISVPIMSLAISPVEAAAIMLPILIVMDFIGVCAYRREFDPVNLRILLPPAIIGIALGWATAAYVTESHVRLIVGVIGLIFSLDYWLNLRSRAREAHAPDVLRGTAWGLIAGFTSFVSHAGSPPFQVYMLPQRLPNAVYVATGVMFFTTVNLVKVIPYAALGQFSLANLSTTAVLLPLAPIATGAGIWLTRRIAQEPFYRIAYAGLLIISVKLIWDGLATLV